MGVHYLSSQLKQAVYEHDHTTADTLRYNQIIYRGWGFIAGTAADSTTIVVTLPNSGFDDANYDVVAHVIGTKNTTDPSSRADVDAGYPHKLTILNSTTANTSTQFQLRIADADGTVIATTRRIVFSWVAIGTKVAG